MKKKTAVILVCGICAAAVAVGVAAKGIVRNYRHSKDTEFEQRSEDKVSEKSDYSETERREVKAADTSELIGEDAAKRAALERAGLLNENVSRIKIELDRDGRALKYEVDFEYQRYEYEIEIDAYSGEVLKFEKEYDD